MLAWNSREEIYQAALRIEKADTTVHQEGIQQEGNKRNASNMTEWSGQPSQYRRRQSSTISFGDTQSQTGSSGLVKLSATEVSITSVGGITQGSVARPPGSAITVTSLGISPENSPRETDKGWLGPSSLSGVVERGLTQDHGLAASQTAPSRSREDALGSSTILIGAETRGL
ncbi:unnamed protein product [Linum trigynum]|uniref:Uncharacterized protein n=1 Tax=Linum trigynum TaxID=586398 RepID=A0AAV2E8S2_9ROSI